MVLIGLLYLSGLSSFSYSQDSIPERNLINAMFGTSYSGWNVQLSYTREIGNHEVGIGGKYVFGGNMNGEKGNYGLVPFWNYVALQNGNTSALIGPSMELLWVNAAGFPEMNRYTEIYLNIGLRHSLAKHIEIGLQVGYGLVHLSLQDRYSVERDSEVRQASTIKVFMLYRL